jgi:uncharacterized protein (DUF2141 family)
MQEPVAELIVAVDDQGMVRLGFGVHPAGDYAIVVVYDEDSDGELHTGFLGFPKERIGFSNGAWGWFGPAKWRDA